MADSRSDRLQGDAAGSADAWHAPEGDSFDVRHVLIIAGLLVVTVVAASVASYLLLSLYGGGSNRVDAEPSPPAVAGPPLQAAPATDLEAYRAEKRSKLRSYRWLNRDKGLVQIPVAEAMRIIAQRSAVERPR
jgi:hypothetical protein